jgi:hypothetical protein
MSDPRSSTSRAWSAAFITLTAIALMAYVAVPERITGVAHVLAWVRGWFQ